MIIRNKAKTNKVIGIPSHFVLTIGSKIFIPFTINSVSEPKTGIAIKTEKNMRKSPIN